MGLLVFTDITINSSLDWLEKVGVPIITSLVGLVAGYYLNKWSEHRKEREKLARIEKIILNDLWEQRKRTVVLIDNYKAVAEKIRDPQGNKLAMVSYHNFGTKVFESHHLTDYSEIFKKGNRYLLLLEIYGIIEFIEKHSPEIILDKHRHEYEILQSRYPYGQDSTRPDQSNPFREAVRGLTEKNVGYTLGMVKNVEYLASINDNFLNKKGK